MTEPLVSAILPVCNRERTVARAIESVLGQSHRPLELIVVDDGSTDGTRRVLESFGSSITLLEQPNAGPYVARNHALRHARGELVAFIDSDDAWLPDRLASQLPLMRPEVGLVFGDAAWRLADGRSAGRTCFDVTPPRRGRVMRHFAWGNFVPTITALVRRSCLEELGGFSEAATLSSDYLMWFRIAQRHEIDYVPAPVAEYTVYSGGISSDLGRSLEARIRLFRDELARASDPQTRHTLRRLLFNHALHLLLASVRRRARSVSHPLRLAWHTAAMVARIEAGPWIAGFAANQVRIRTRRLFS